MKKLLIIPLVVGLASCNSAAGPTTVVKYEVVTPRKSIYDCPLYKEFPNADTLTDVQVAKTIVKLYKNNVRCKNSINAIEKFLNNAKATVEGPDPQEDAPPPTKLFGLF